MGNTPEGRADGLAERHLLSDHDGPPGEGTAEKKRSHNNSNWKHREPRRPRVSRGGYVSGNEDGRTSGEGYGLHRGRTHMVWFTSVSSPWNAGNCCHS